MVNESRTPLQLQIFKSNEIIYYTHKSTVQVTYSKNTLYY